MNVFGIGLPEMALIMAIALLVFGPKKLPEIGRSMGKAIRGFQDASKEFENEFKREADRIEKSDDRPMEAKIEPPEPRALSGQKDNNGAATESMDEVVAQAASPEPETTSESSAG
jgi:sec-independent protein translocase protein TatA